MGDSRFRPFHLAIPGIFSELKNTFGNAGKSGN
jgi:hypothetical protein